MTLGMKAAEQTDMKSCGWISRILVAAVAVLGSFAAVAELSSELRLPAEPVRPGVPAEFRVVLLGAEPGAAYTLLPPEPSQATEVAWGTLEWGGLRTTSGADGQTEVGLSLMVTATDEGEHEVPSLQMRAIQVTESAPLAGETLDPASAVLVPTKPVRFGAAPDRMPMYLGIAAVLATLLLLALAVALTLRARAARQAEVVIGGTPQEQAREHLHLARRHRLDGDFYKFYQSLSAAAKALEAGSAQASLSPALDARAQEVGYRGVRPTEDEMDGAIKDLERALTQRKEDS